LPNPRNTRASARYHHSQVAFQHPIWVDLACYKLAFSVAHFSSTTLPYASWIYFVTDSVVQLLQRHNFSFFIHILSISVQ